MSVKTKDFAVLIEPFRRHKGSSAGPEAYPTPRATPSRRLKREERSSAPAISDIMRLDASGELKPVLQVSKKRRRSDEGSDSYDPSDRQSSSGSEPQSTKPPAPTPTPRKKQKVLKYAPPEVYAHIKGLTDQLQWHNVLWFCGINPGKRSGETGCAYAHPSNHFWRAIFEAELTTQREAPTASSNGLMCQKYDFGMTNLVDRVTSQETELKPSEKLEAVPAFLAKVQHFHPRMVCFIGKGIFDAILTVILHHATYVSSKTPFNGGKAMPKSGENGVAKKAPQPVGVKARSGLSPVRIRHADGDLTYFYVQFSTSGLCRDAQFPDSVEIFRDVKVIIDELRHGHRASLEHRHSEEQWLELDVDVFLQGHPAAEVPASIKVALDLVKTEDAPPLVSRDLA